MGSKQRVRLRMQDENERTESWQQTGGDANYADALPDKVPQAQKGSAPVEARAGPERGKEAEGALLFGKQLPQRTRNGGGNAWSAVPQRANFAFAEHPLCRATTRKPSRSSQNLFAARQWYPMTKHMTTWSFWKRLGQPRRRFAVGSFSKNTGRVQTVRAMGHLALGGTAEKLRSALLEYSKSESIYRSGQYPGALGIEGLPHCLMIETSKH